MSSKSKNRNPASRGSGSAGSNGGTGANRPKGGPNKGSGTPSKRERADARRRQEELKRKGSWAVLFVGIAVVVGIIGLAVKSSVDNANAGVASASEWELPLLDGSGDITLASYAGKPVVVNFFASWCTACEAELPEFRAAVDQYGDQVEFVFVNSQETNSSLGRAMAERHGIDGLTIAKDFGERDGAFFRALGGRGMPITAFYDADGTLQFVSSGAMVGGALEAALTEFGYI